MINHSKLFFLNNKENFNKYTPINNIKAIIVPHAGLSYSGNTANQAYGRINWNNYNRIVILSTHHNNGTFIPQSKNFILNDDTYIFNNEGLDDIIKNDKVFEKEHSWLVQLPFIEKKDNLTVILVNQYNDKIFNSIFNIIEEDTLLIANTDLLHCGPNYNNICPDNVDEINNNTIKDIIEFKDLDSNSLCGFNVIKLFNQIIKLKNYKYHSKYYQTSDKIEPSENSVGYTTIIYTNQNKDNLDINNLLKIPRKVMESELVKSKLGKRISNLELIELTNKLSDDTIYKYSYGIFVTIENNKELRGCIGQFNQSDKLDKLITKLTLKSAFFDSRFYDNMITKEELSELSYKVNFLKRPIKIYPKKKNIYDSVKDNMIIGVHGITLYFDNNNSSTYLANVITDLGINEINKELWKKLKNSLSRKANSMTNSIVKIEIYECKEFDENTNLYNIIY
jgi:AmmeMemoRadiSam system protein B/uncharacterized protein (TIGR00296 family)